MEASTAIRQAAHEKLAKDAGKQWKWRAQSVGKLEQVLMCVRERERESEGERERERGDRERERDREGRERKRGRRERERVRAVSEHTRAGAC